MDDQVEDAHARYAEFLAQLHAEDRVTRDLGGGAVEVLLGQPHSEPRRVEVRVTPAEVRHAVVTPSLDEEIDESDDDRLHGLLVDAVTALGRLRPAERFVVFEDDSFHPSVRSELPAERAPASFEEKRNPGSWSPFDHDDPRFGGPGSILGHRAGGETDLGALLTSMDPVLHRERYVFSTTERLPAGLEPIATVREPEGLSVIIEEAQATEHELPYDYVAAMVTLRVHSAPAAVGLTAAVSTALAERGISCNVVAGFFHDHLFVPYDRGWDVLDALEDLREKRPGSLRPVSAVAQLSVRRGSEAVAFYRKAFGAEVVFSVGGDEESPDVVAQLVVGDATFWVSDEAPEHGNHSPESLGGATTRMLLVVDDPAAVVARAVEAGARLVAEPEDSHAWLLGRVEDPFGHSWEIGRPLLPWPPPV